MSFAEAIANFKGLVGIDRQDVDEQVVRDGHEDDVFFEEDYRERKFIPITVELEGFGEVSMNSKGQFEINSEQLQMLDRHMQESKDDKYLLSSESLGSGKFLVSLREKNS